MHMDVIEIRHRNLLQLLDELAQKGATRNVDQAQRLVMSTSFLSQLKGGKKMGDDVARKIESATSKPHGWMDHPQWDSSDSESQADVRSHVERLDARKIAETAQALRIVFAKRGAKFDIEIDAEIFVVAYQLRLQLPDRMTDADLLDFGINLADTAQVGSAYGRDDREDSGSADRAPPRRSAR